MQNLSNATTTRFQLNSIPEKNSKNVKKVFSAFLPPHAVAVPCAIREERRDMRGNGENYIITFWLPSLATLVFFVYIFIFSVLLFTSVCLLRVRKRFSSLNIQAISTSHPMHIFRLMKWYHEHSFEIKYDFFSGGNIQIKIHTGESEIYQISWNFIPSQTTTSIRAASVRFWLVGRFFLSKGGRFQNL